MYAIFDYDVNDWIRELPSKVDDGGIAILVFTSKREACQRAAKHYGYDSYSQASKDGCVKVLKLV